MPSSTTINYNKNIKVNQYTKLPKLIIQSTKLSPYAKLVYGCLRFRMQLSITKGSSFYNQKGNFYYVIYQIKDLMHDTGSGRRAIINALKQLVNYGLVIKHRMIHVMELELPKLHLSTSKNAKKASVNRIKTFRNKKSVYANDTKKRIKINKNKIRDKAKQYWNKIKLSVTKTNLNRHYKLPKDLINSVDATSSHDYHAFKSIIGLLFKAKKASLNKLKSKYHKPSIIINRCLSFEHNRCYSGEMSDFVDEDSLNGQYRRAWCSAKKTAHRVSMKHPSEYQNVFDRTIMKCLINYFYECGELEIINLPKKETGPEIPIFTL